MFASSALVLSLATGLVAASANPYSDALVSHQVHALAKRAESPSSSSYLSDVFGMVTSQCEKTCSVGLNDLAACSKLTTQATIAACACSSVTLGDLRSCASCISTTTKSTGNATEVVNSYNSFVDLCTNEGLARVTGTVEVGASTTALSRSSKSSASTIPSSAASSRATYNPSSAPASTATVPSLVATGSIASSARIAAASASPSGSGNGAGRVVASFSAVGALVGAFALLA
ncbi:hypothetical protein JCM6882_001142 [Rhodosporidiobolus microsporus]